MRSTRARLTRFIALASALVLTAGLQASSVAAAGAPPGQCPDVMPTAQLEEGMMGRGWTVARGDTPERFRVEVLGVLEDGIAPGRDLIVVEVSDVEGGNIIANAGGIWAGMSGSPVYVNGQLIGAIAYGFTFGPSRIGGVTPAEDMVRVLEYGRDTSAAANLAGADRISVPQGMRGELAARAGVSEQEASSLERLPVPLAVSGLSQRGRERLQERFDEAGHRVFVTPGATARRPSGTSAFGTPQPGGNFAAMLSYGDLSAGGIGTTTYVCNGRALAFGHPFFFMGETTMGANDADALAIVADPTLTPFKLANVAELFGRVNQDRLAAIRARLGVAPPLIPITSDVRAVDSGRQRTGRTDVTMSPFVPDIAAFHLFLNIDSVFDEIGDGTSRVAWVARGTRANGEPWELRRSNRYASQWDISFESVFEMYAQLATIFNNRFERVKFDSVSVEARVDDTFRLYSVETVRISKNGGPFREREMLRVRPGDELTMRVVLRLYRGDTRRVDLSLRVPQNAAGEGFLSVRGGGSEDDFFEAAGHEDGGGEVNSFPELLESLESRPKNHDLVAALQFFGSEGEPAPARTTSTRLDSVVRGGVDIFVIADPGR